MIPKSWFIDARSTIAPYTIVTSLTYDKEQDLYLKWENHQVTGSFKARGALNKVLHLKKWEQKAGLLAASAGNHGQGVALAGILIGSPTTIYVPENAPRIKIQAIQSYGAKVIFIPGGYNNAENAAIKAASESKATWISPYNDGHIIAGQGTIALEILDQLQSFDDSRIRKATWLVPTSGGGLLSGIATVTKELNPESKVIGVQAETSPFMYALYHKKNQDNILERPTIADGLAGPVEHGSITIPIIRELVDDLILVNENEIAKGISYAWYSYGERIEGSAAVVLSAILMGKIKHRPLVLILSGGNIEETLFTEITGSRL